MIESRKSTHFEEDMNGNRYRNNNRFARPPNNNARWRSDQSFSCFGYRRHELNEGSPPNIGRNEALVRRSPMPGTVDRQETNSAGNSRGHSQRGRLSNEAFRPTRFQENRLGSLYDEQRAEREMQHEDAMSEAMKAAFDTDFRLQSPVKAQEQWRSQPKSSYGNLAEAPEVPKRLPPILKNSHNPWQEDSRFRPIESPRNPAQARNQEHSCNSLAQNGQHEPNTFRDASMPKVPWNHAPEMRPGPGFIEAPENRQGQQRDWHPSSERFDQSNSRGYFEKLKQQEHHKNLFGNREALLNNLHAKPLWSEESNQNSSFVNCREELSFSTFGGANTPGNNFQTQENRTAVSNNFQGTWRDKSEGNSNMRGNFRKPGTQNRRGNRGRPCLQSVESSRKVESKPYARNWSGHPLSNPSAPSVPKEQQQWEGASSPKAQKSQEQRPLDARAILERKRKCAVEEETPNPQPQVENALESEESSVRPALPQLHQGRFGEHLDQKTMRVQNTDSPRNKNTQRWIESHFSEDDPFEAAVPEVHEVDESKLLPADVPLDQLLHVVFLDIDKRSFFDEVKQAFLPGTLVYLFFGDPSVLLPTREHPFYKENKNNWVYFYPDCSTEYGSYLVAAPAVIGWMDQQLPQRVRFLVHGHQKQLKLEGLQRKVTFYPTSRTIDVHLLNRMLNGDFEPAQTARTGVPAGKTVVIRKNPKPLLPSPPSTTFVGHCSKQTGTPAQPSPRQRIRPVMAPTSTTNPPRRTPIVPPRQPTKPDAPPQRKKIVW